MNVSAYSEHVADYNLKSAGNELISFGIEN